MVHATYLSPGHVLNFKEMPMFLVNILDPMHVGPIKDHINYDTNISFI